MEEYYKDNIQTKACVESFDLGLMNKANKSDIIELGKKMRGIAHKDDMTEFKQTTMKRIEDLTVKAG